MPDGLFTRDGDIYRPTRLTIGPWSPDAQHGGAPAALVAGAIEAAPSSVEMVMTRMTVELLRPVPLQPLKMTTEIVRPGRRVQLVAVYLSAADQEVLRGLGLRIRQRNIGSAFPPATEREIAPLEEGRPAVFFDNAGAFATEAMEIRMIEGDFAEPGPGKAWLRLRYPVVAGEETTPSQRVAAAADFGNGISNLVGTERTWVFINPDLTIYMARRPVGEWTYLDASSQVDPSGIGLASSTLADQMGRLGTASQSLYVEPMAER